MQIAFDNLPDKRIDNEITEEPIEKGCYLVIVKAAEMRESKDMNPYLNLKLEIKDTRYKGRIVFDVLSGSDKNIAMYKLRRFIIATGLDKALRNKSFELADLAKLVVNKIIYADITMEKPKEGYKPRPIIDCFNNEIYYSADQINQTNQTEQISIYDNIINTDITEDNFDELL